MTVGQPLALALTLDPNQDESETLLQSAADFADTTENRNLIDAVAEANQWRPYRSIVVYLMYHLQEDNLVLL